MADSWSIEVLCPDDNRPSGGIMDGIAVMPVRYMPKKLQTLGGAGGILPSLKANPFKLLLLPLLLASLLIQALIRARTADVIHANWAICGIVAAIAGKFTGKKVVLTLRGSDFEKSRNSAVFKWQLQFALAGADFIVCVSESMKNDLLHAYPHYADKMGCCLNGVDNAFFESQSVAIDPDASLQILAVGGLIPVKGFDVLLKALHLLPEDTRYVLTIVGEGPERATMQACIKHYGLEEKVILKGELPYRVMPEIMAASDLFVLSSRAEGRPNVVAEAVACALPVVSSDLPGVRGLVEPGKNGWLFEAGNAQALSLRILQAIENKGQLRFMGQSGREAIRAHSSWSVTSAYYSKLFTGLIAGTGS